VENFHNPILPPGLEAKVALVQKLAKQENVDLPKDVALYIARNIGFNARAFRGAIIRLSAHLSLTGTEITLQYTQRVLKNFTDFQRPHATAHPFQGMLSGEPGSRQATGTRQHPTAEDRSSFLFVLKTRDGRKITRAQQEFAVNMREHEREQLAHRDGYERDLERSAKKRKSG
jgi:hypothetical protein